MLLINIISNLVLLLLVFLPLYVYYFRLDKDKEKCVEDNTKKCSDDEKKPIEENNNKSRDNDKEFNPKPCRGNPCKDNVTCHPYESGKFECRCPPGLVGKKCDEGEFKL